MLLINTGLSYKKGDLSLSNSGIRIVRGGNISPMKFTLIDSDYHIDKQFINSDTIYLRRNQLLTPVSTSLEHVGKFARLKEAYPNTVAGGFVFQLTPLESSDTFSQYLEYSLSSSQFYNQIKEITNLSGQALYNIPKSKVIKLILPLPSKDEQAKIIEQIQRYFQYVSQIEEWNQ